MVLDIGRIEPRRIEDELRSAYLDYAMSVIVQRALPDVRDGLKPVQRRILYAMDELAMRPGTAYKKSARLVGEVLGKYHPHGDASVYDAMVRLAQDFTMRHPLVDGQGNFGSIDNDPPAAMRYTEARLAPIAMQMLQDLDRNTVDLAHNFDDSLREPTVLPARLPNLLVNGASGIAVGMATSIPPHNLGEVCNAICHLIDHPEATSEELLRFVQGPDFPTGGIILAGEGRQGIVEAYTSGRGRVLVRGRAEVQPLGRTGRHQIVITEIPYQVNKATMVERIALLAKERKVEGIGDVRDESDRHGLRVVVELRSSAQPEIVLNNLYKHTPLQMAFNMNMLALVEGQPVVLTLRDALHHYVGFRVQVVTRRARFDLEKARERAHLLEGLLKAIGALDLVVQIIRGSEDVEAARSGLMAALDLSEAQAQAILEMQLRRLTALDRRRLEEEHQGLVTTMAELEALLADPARVLAAARTETRELGREFANPRRTTILEEAPRVLNKEELVLHSDVVVTLSQNGYIKRIPLSTYKLQHRGGKGVVGMRSAREDDVLRHLLVAGTHDTLIFFTNRGRVLSARCFDIGEDLSRTSRGTLLQNLLPGLPSSEAITAVVAFPDLGLDAYLVLATRRGEIKRVPLERFASIRSTGIIAMDLAPEDSLVSAAVTIADREVVVVTRGGMSVCFPVNQLQVRSRTAGGVRAIRLKDGDEVVSMEVVRPEGSLLLVTRNGFGKLTRMKRFRRQGRGGSGIIAFKVTLRTGPLAAALMVEGTEDLVISTARAKVHRTSLSEVAEYGRYAKGVWVMHPDDADYITAVAVLSPYSRRRGADSVPQPGAPVNGTQAGLPLDLEEEPDAEEEEPEGIAETEQPDGPEG